MITTWAWLGVAPGSGTRNLAQAPIEVRPLGTAQESLEVLVGVGHEADVEGADRLLQDTPHCLAKVADHAHEGQPREARRANLAVVGIDQPRVLLWRKLVIDAEVAQVEERVAHPRVLPIYDPDPLSVVDEVGVEQVVVAGPQLNGRLQEGALDAARGFVRPIPGCGNGHAVRDRERTVGLDDPERDEEAGDGRTLVDAAQRVDDAPDGRPLVDLLQRHRLTHDEASDEVALRADEGDYFWTHPDAGGGDRGGMLHLAADAEQMGVVASQPDDVAVVAVTRRHQEVAVGDAARNRGEDQLSSGGLRHALE